MIYMYKYMDVHCMYMYMYMYMYTCKPAGSKATCMQNVQILNNGVHIHVDTHVLTSAVRLTSAPVSMSAFITSKCPYLLAFINGL